MLPHFQKQIGKPLDWQVEGPQIMSCSQVNPTENRNRVNHAVLAIILNVVVGHVHYLSLIYIRWYIPCVFSQVICYQYMRGVISVKNNLNILYISVSQCKIFESANDTQI